MRLAGFADHGRGDAARLPGRTLVETGDRVGFGSFHIPFERPNNPDFDYIEDALINLFAFELPMQYFEQWIRREAIPPRSEAFPDAPQDLEFEVELFDVVNSMWKLEESTITKGVIGNSIMIGPSFMDSIDFGGIENCVGQNGRQDYFAGAFAPDRFKRMILRGHMGGNDLTTALVWGFMIYFAIRRDMADGALDTFWHAAVSQGCPAPFTSALEAPPAPPTSAPAGALPLLLLLPVDVLQPILRRLPLASLASLAA
ncbi:hypothetical protein HK405_008867, partial [Cladochytrium tenue]